MALERRQLGTVADKFVVEGILDAAAALAAARRDANTRLQFGMPSGSSSDWVQAASDSWRARRTVSEASAADDDDDWGTASFGMGAPAPAVTPEAP